MTVQEAVEFSAKLRCSREISRIDLQHLTRSTLDLIGLAKASQTIIGSERQKGISGGEKRRTSIAVEIVCNPSVIFLDEPTSGLDAHTQLTVVHRLKWLANHGRIVVTTIHSPSSEMLSMFDMIIILKEGRMVYQGPSNLIPYFSSLGYRFPRFVVYL
jgi:ATP-binding cassette subfamily G (WHITE) protein 1